MGNMITLNTMMLSAFNKVKAGFGVLFKFGVIDFACKIRYGQGYSFRDISLMYFLLYGVVSVNRFPFCLSKLSRWLKDVVKRSSSSIIVLTHDWGGGADSYLTNMINDTWSNMTVFVVRPTETPRIINVNVYCNGRMSKEFLVKGLSFLSHINLNETEVVINELIRWHQYDRSRAVSINSLMCLINEIIKVKKTLGAKLTYLVHDYYCVCPRYNLMSSTGCYCDSESDEKKCTSCLTDASFSILPLMGNTNISDWRKTFSLLFSECYEIRTFSEDTYRRIRRCFPDISPTILPHKQAYVFERKPPITGGSLVVGVFGRIDKIKGAQIIIDLARLLATQKPEAKIIVVGELLTDSKAPLPRNIAVLGRYKVAELPKIIAKNGVNVAFMSSIVPETFSYVTQELVALGVPLVSFNIGAPKDVVGNYDKGAVAQEISAESALNAIIGLYEKIYA